MSQKIRVPKHEKTKLKFGKQEKRDSKTCFNCKQTKNTYDDNFENDQIEKHAKKYFNSKQLSNIHAKNCQNTYESFFGNFTFQYEFCPDSNKLPPRYSKMSEDQKYYHEIYIYMKYDKLTFAKAVEKYKYSYASSKIQLLIDAYNMTYDEAKNKDF